MKGVVNNGMALDARGLDSLKAQARDDPKAAARQAARQFEAQFAQMLLAQMRTTSLAGDGDVAKMFNSPAAQQWRGMLDQQLAQSLAGLPTTAPGAPATNSSAPMPERSGLGLADMLERQLTRQTVSADSVGPAGGDVRLSTLALAKATGKGVDGQPLSMGGAPLQMPTRTADGGFVAPALLPAGMGPAGSAYGQRRIQNGRFESQEPSVATARAARVAAETVPGDDNREAFIRKFLPAAQRAESLTGIPAEFMLGQAALESGWGKREIRGSDGQPTHNLFGIKATGWSGKVSMNMTTEYTNGKAERVREPFRAYDSYDHAFEDYARLLSRNPRYAAVVRADTAHEFAHGMQRAGYATDPKYGEKLMSTIRTAQKLSM